MPLPRSSVPAWGVAANKPASRFDAGLLADRLKAVGGLASDFDQQKGRPVDGIVSEDAVKGAKAAGVPTAMLAAVIVLGSRPLRGARSLRGHPRRPGTPGGSRRRV